VAQGRARTRLQAGYRVRGDSKPASMSPGCTGSCPGVGGHSESDPPDWSWLLAYYAATQRHDPRGRIEELADRQGKTWSLVQTSGRWWSGAELVHSLCFQRIFGSHWSPAG